MKLDDVITNLERAVTRDDVPADLRETLEDSLRRLRRTSRNHASYFACAKCGEWEPMVEGYMVNDSLWLSVMPSRKGYLHLGCLESMIGRPLAAGDFPPLPVNDAVLFGFGKSVTR